MHDHPILILADTESSATRIARMLQESGWDTETTAGTSDALAAVTENRYRAVIADEKFLMATEGQILEVVKSIHSAPPLIVTTSEGSVKNAVQTMRMGAADYLLKPFSRETLCKSVQRAVKSPNRIPKTGRGEKDSAAGDDCKQIITQDPRMQHVLEVAQNVAASTATVLILGESGTGKELLAAHIHRHSNRSTGPFVAVNCAALPETLAESELFGHEKGAFTGALSRKLGRFEQADGGTILLDEVSEMPSALQAKLLRVLQERVVDRVGGTGAVRIDTRVIAISNLDLKAAVARGRFREDLFYRLNVIPLSLPPLRQREGDVNLLTRHFLEKFSRLNRRPAPLLTRAAARRLNAHEWKGNVRELENTIERAVLMSTAGCIDAQDLFLETASPGDSSPLKISAGVSVREMEKALVLETLKHVNENRTHAAKMLGISIRTLRNKLHEYQLEQETACQAGQTG